ncbi:Conserved_hypothetical protein [Hexamita inflata]|uniref:Uncharacterized protein n=1 Tax=Hexamita inflata TaxID=28002 RepID=A0AA86NT08_9EUKA|nr:Conserved hypothetical protein [Hexamita inflata]
MNLYNEYQNIENQTLTAAKVIDFNLMIINQSITDQDTNKKLRNRAKQMRAEGPASNVPLRNATFPVQDLQQPYIYLQFASQEVRKQHGQLIFERICNYLRLLAAKGFYPKGKLEEQIIILLNEQGTVFLENIQLVPKYLSKQPQKLDQLLALRYFLFAEMETPKSGDLLDFYFPSKSLPKSVESINQIAKLVKSIDEINLQESPGMIYIRNGQAVTTQQIFEARVATFEENRADLWVLLARFCNERTAVQRQQFLPHWLHDYIKYQYPLKLPLEFISNINCVNTLETLRIILGVYPKPIIFKKPEVKLNQNIQRAYENLDIWFQQKIYQMLYLCHEFKVGSVKNEGVIMQCEASTLLELILQYE